VLARTELVPVGRQAGIAAGLLTVGAVFMLVFLIFISLTGVYVLTCSCRVGFGAHRLWRAAFDRGYTGGSWR
jgi:hypothetical protein